jgi:hypothetical protein
MDQKTTHLRYNLLKLAIAIIVFVALAVYGTITLASQDPMWFVQGFNDRPIRVVVYNAGVRTELQSGQPGFDELASAVVQSLNQGVARQSGIGLSRASLQDAYNRYVTVEAFFSRPVKMHAWFNTHQPTQMLFPVEGRHAELSVVFMGSGGIYLSNAPVLNTVEPIRVALKALGYY